MPVSSRTSRRAAASGFSPASTRPLGRQRVGFAPRATGLAASGVAARGCCGSSMAAIHHCLLWLRRTTPPDEISRAIFSAMACKLPELGELVTMGDLAGIAGNRQVRSHVAYHVTD